MITNNYFHRCRSFPEDVQPPECSNIRVPVNKDKCSIKTQAINYSEDSSMDVIENSDIDTPVKVQQKHCNVRVENSDSSDESINTSTISLSRSHNFFKSPAISPYKVADKEIMSTEREIITSIPAKYITNSALTPPDCIGPKVNTATRSGSSRLSQGVHQHPTCIGLEAVLVNSPPLEAVSYNTHQHLTCIELNAAPANFSSAIPAAVIDTHQYHTYTEVDVNGTEAYNNLQTFDQPVAEHTYTGPEETQFSISPSVLLSDLNNTHQYQTSVELNVAPVNSSTPTQAVEDDTHQYDTYTKLDGSRTEATNIPRGLDQPVAEDTYQQHTYTEPEDNSSNTEPVTSIQASREKRKSTKASKKSYLDFKSDEEQGDFSGGSSDIWTGSSTSNSDDEQIKKKGKKKKRTKTKSSAEIAIVKKEKRINTYKLNRKLKEEGKEYVRKKGDTVPAKSMKRNPCVEGICKRGCYNISEERRQSIFNFYWSLDRQRQHDWLVRCAHTENIRRKRVESNKRSLTIDYYINDGEDHKKICQKFLLCTLDITQKVLLYTIAKAEEGMSLKESRKRHAPNKYSEPVKIIVRKYIENLPACPSHYNRKNSKRMYLPQELRNLSNLYRLYLEHCKKQGLEIVSEVTFRHIFNTEYDLGFHTPKKDKCVLCLKAENLCDEMTERDKEIYKKHLEEKVAMKRRYKAHQALNDGKTMCSSFDLQKVLNTPYGESMLLYYARKYAVFNLTVYESLTRNVYCFTWGECDGRRGSTEIATCLYLYLKELDKQGVETALLYCDSCTGQNKNKVVLSVLNYFLAKSVNLQIIQINYLLPGHTYMPVDSVHATIEKEVRKIIVWSPTQWSSYFEAARKTVRPYNVHVLEHTDFINWEEIASKTFTKDTCKNINFKDIRIATFKKKHLNKIDIKYSMKEDAVARTVILFEKPTKKGKGKGKAKRASEAKNEDQTYLEELNTFTLPKAYSEKIPISALKYKDLKKLCLDGTIPKRFHKDYLDLPYIGDKKDTLIETDEEDDNDENNDVD